jgi:hypothetical protein
MNEAGQSGRTNHGVRRRESAWNVLLVVFGLQAIGVTWWGLFRLVVVAQSFLAPQNHFGRNMSDAGEILMVIPLAFPALAVGMMAADVRTWLIPAARYALDREARLSSGIEFRTATKQLAVAALILMAIAVPLSLFGALDIFK